ncbi:MAG: outer membrane protein assembly factor BamC [Oxalobacter sp.]|jgi:outer membrane protein assembly factor BamC|nr:MAG: outer membrane protein assembly factor BamC [Oxalobacter sp.]
MGHRHTAVRGLLSATCLLGLLGCSSVSGLLEADKIDYKTATEKQSSTSLQIPPDLTQIRRDDRYAMPAGSVTASEYQQKQAAKPVTAMVAPNAVGMDIRIERAGKQRWLVVKKSPDELWPVIKAFWQDTGFLLKIDQPETGIMETEWAENRAKLPQDFIRRTLGKVLDSVYSTGELDKFRTRLERTPDGSTEIFISHRGAQEVLTGPEKERSMWEPRPSDPELEAEFLARLMVRLGLENERVKEMVAKGEVMPMRAKLVKGDDKAQPYVQVDEAFDRAWRRVGLALDRVGFTVEDRDRSKGLYYVRYVDQDGIQKEEKSWFGSSSKKKEAQRYRIFVKGDVQSSQISVLDANGVPERSSASAKILSLLHDQLK